MHRSLIDTNKCLKCKVCLVEKNCESHAIIKESEDDKPFVDFYKCTGCLKCKVVCKGRSIEIITQPCTGKPKMGW
jgi:MinD superfamily P-loop ATPase